MRLTTILFLTLTVMLVISLRSCNGARVRGLSLTEEDDDFNSPRLYRDYMLRKRPVRAEENDQDDDYGHFRFGRSFE